MKAQKQQVVSSPDIALASQWLYMLSRVLWCVFVVEVCMLCVCVCVVNVSLLHIIGYMQATEC